ncbi:MAG: DsrE family protein [archaeon]
MKLGIVLSSSEPEIVWNAFRFGVTSLKSNHEVKVFLINKGVEAEGLTDEKFNVKEQIKSFISSNGIILACGSCLKIRQKEGSNVCPISTMQDLLKMVEESDKVVCF